MQATHVLKTQGFDPNAVSDIKGSNYISENQANKLMKSMNSIYDKGMFNYSYLWVKEVAGSVGAIDKEYQDPLKEVLKAGEVGKDVTGQILIFGGIIKKAGLDGKPNG